LSFDNEEDREKDARSTRATFTTGCKGSEPILGVLALEGLGISVDPKTRSLKRERARSLK
jgi:predicted aspartyl protease